MSRGAPGRVITKPGEVHCLLGSSGGGKTTLLRLVAGLERHQQDHVVISGRQVATPDQHIPPEARSVGFVFQDYALFPHLTVRDNVSFGVSERGRTARLERVRSRLASVGMADFERAMPPAAGRRNKVRPGKRAWFKKGGIQVTALAR